MLPLLRRLPYAVEIARRGFVKIEAWQADENARRLHASDEEIGRGYVES
jgi:hypothetical protein